MKVRCSYQMGLVHTPPFTSHTSWLKGREEPDGTARHCCSFPLNRATATMARQKSSRKLTTSTLAMLSMDLPSDDTTSLAPGRRERMRSGRSARSAFSPLTLGTMVLAMLTSTMTSSITFQPLRRHAPSPTTTPNTTKRHAISSVYKIVVVRSSQYSTTPSVDDASNAGESHASNTQLTRISTSTPTLHTSLCTARDSASRSGLVGENRNSDEEVKGGGGSTRYQGRPGG